MNLNNYLKIEERWSYSQRPPKKVFAVLEKDADGEGANFLGEFEDLREAIECANKYEREEGTEYGLRIELFNSK